MKGDAEDPPPSPAPAGSRGGADGQGGPAGASGNKERNEVQGLGAPAPADFGPEHQQPLGSRLEEFGIATVLADTGSLEGGPVSGGSPRDGNPVASEG